MRVIPCLLLRSATVVLLAVLCCSGAPTLTGHSSVQSTATTSARVASIPVELVNDNYVLIKASVNGSGPLTFILDTGAGSGLVLYFKAAQALGLKLEGKGKGGGAGEDTFQTRSIKGVSLSFSGVEMSNQTFVVFPPERTASALDKVVDGVIGYTLFSRYVVEIDYQARVVNLYEPQSYRYVGTGEVLPLRILSNVPFAKARVTVPGGKSFEGEFLIDSGAGRFTSILNTPFVESNKLLALTPKTIKEPDAKGVGGRVNLLIGRLPGVQLGRFIFVDPVVHFSQDRRGALASDDYSGIIGGELLRRFKSVFDYTHKRMILEPNGSMSEPFEYDMSGIRLRVEGADLKSFRVSTVVEDSPAAEVGVREGDVISAIDDKPGAELSLSQISQMLRREGKEYLLTIMRGEQKQQIKLKLRRLI